VARPGFGIELASIPCPVDPHRRPTVGGRSYAAPALDFADFADFSDLIRPDRYPRSARYDPAWVVALDMGPNPLWLLENLLPHLELRPGMRVLDLGSGKGATSVFLAREFGVRVSAVDWWIRAEHAAATFRDAGVADQVTAVRAEAHALPFDQQWFDAVVCIDAFEYFGADDGYLPYLARFVRPAGRIAVATPALRTAPEPGRIPAHIAAVVGDEALRWHPAEWWRALWERSGVVDVLAARLQEDGWDDWLRWQRAADRFAGHFEGSAVLDMLLADRGEQLTFALLTAQVR
jgi:SAM-dependent methyltransferase